MHPAMHHLSQLPVSERLHLVQELWDSIGETQADLPVQEWHRELVKARLMESEVSGKDSSLSRKQLWQQVDDSRDS